MCHGGVGFQVRGGGGGGTQIYNDVEMHKVIIYNPKLPWLLGLTTVKRKKSTSHPVAIALTIWRSS